MLGISTWKKGRGSWCHGVPEILLPTFRGALGRGTCLEYLLGKRDGGVGATRCLRYGYQRFGEPWEGERAWNICLEKGTGELVPWGACDIATNVSGSPRNGNLLAIFAWKKGRESWCPGVPAILLPTFRGALGRGRRWEHFQGGHRCCTCCASDDKRLRMQWKTPCKIQPVKWSILVTKKAFQGKGFCDRCLIALCIG